MYVHFVAKSSKHRDAKGKKNRRDREEPLNEALNSRISNVCSSDPTFHGRNTEEGTTETFARLLNEIVADELCRPREKLTRDRFRRYGRSLESRAASHFSLRVPFTATGRLINHTVPISFDRGGSINKTVAQTRARYLS